MSPLHVLCLDIAGGFGGSSRSLYESLRHMKAGALRAEVWCRRDGPVRDGFAALGIPCHLVPEMPRMNSLPRAFRNLVGYARTVRDILMARALRVSLMEALARFDLVHLNREGLLLRARLDTFHFGADNDIL